VFRFFLAIFVMATLLGVGNAQGPGGPLPPPGKVADDPLAMALRENAAAMDRLAATVAANHREAMTAIAGLAAQQKLDREESQRQWTALHARFDKEKAEREAMETRLRAEQDAQRIRSEAQHQATQTAIAAARCNCCTRTARYFSPCHNSWLPYRCQCWYGPLFHYTWWSMYYRVL